MVDISQALGVACGVLQPVLEARRTEPGCAERNERAFLDRAAEIAGLRVSHDLARVADGS
jgi:hypothetical protein